MKYRTKAAAPAQRHPFPPPVKIADQKFYRRSELDFFKLAIEAQARGLPLPPKAAPPVGDPLVAHRHVAREFDVGAKTIDRWVEAGQKAAAEAVSGIAAE